MTNHVPAKTVDMRFSVMSTVDGTYYNATQGGRLSVNSERVNSNLSQTVREGQVLTLRAEANEGYSFAGYYNSDNNSIPLSLSAEYSFIVSSDVSEIYASFAKNYDITFTVGDPFNSGSTLSFTETFYVGQKVTISDVIANSSSLGTEYAEYFKNSTAEMGQGENVGGFSFAKNQITVGAGSANLTIQPSAPTNVGFTGGGNLEIDPYIISTKEELIQLANDVNSGTNYSGKYFRLGNSIELTQQFYPIGCSSSRYFAGNFDGAGYTISGLDVRGHADGSTSYVGLFGYTNGATIKNLTVSGTVSGSDNVGGIVGRANESTIANVQTLLQC